MGAQLEVIVSLDEQKDRGEIERLKLPPLTLDYLAGALRDRYRTAGFALVGYDEITDSQRRFDSSWGRRLQDDPRRKVLYLKASAIEQ